MKHTAIFISNKNYFDATKKEGGVRQCTLEYFSLISLNYEVSLFEVEYNLDLFYRLRVKFGLNAYNDYQTKFYKRSLFDTIRFTKAKIVFLNLSNLAPFASIIKDEFYDEVKVVLCSHGNESGDFLHDTTRFRLDLPFYKKITSSITLGRMLQKESLIRQNSIDAVLTVSQIEESIEKWLGAKNVLMIPRTLKSNKLNLSPVLFRVGFIGDLSHHPNYHGIDQVCKSIEKSDNSSRVTLSIVGSPNSIGESLSSRYSFVNYLGYLNEVDLVDEVSTWAFFLNPVFYYSKGVSTKLAKALSWGIPVITTSIGCRGYIWNEGRLVIAESPDEFRDYIFKLASNYSEIQYFEKESEKIILSSSSLEEISRQLNIFLQGL
jgi:glycosyltransferase involved in cell wall biosynthesis